MLAGAGMAKAVEFPQNGFQSTSSLQMSNSSLSSSVGAEATVQEYYIEASAPGISAGPARLPGAGGTPFPPMPNVPDPNDQVHPIGDVPMVLLALVAAAWAFARKRKEDKQLEIED